MLPGAWTSNMIIYNSHKRNTNEKQKATTFFFSKPTSYSFRAVANQVELKAYIDAEGSAYIICTVFTCITLKICETKLNKSV